MLFLNNLKLATVVASAVVMMAGFGSGQATESTAKPRVTRRTNAPVPKPVPREGVIVITSFCEDKLLEIVKPDGTGSKFIKLEDQFQPYSVKLSPDGKKLLYTDLWRIVVRPGKSLVKFSIRLLDLEAANSVPTILTEEAYFPSVAWAADGKSVYYSHTDPDKPEEPEKKGEMYHTCL